MLGRTYENQVCSIARVLEVVGERWSILIMRTAIFRGVTKFTDFQRSLGIAPNILANRLETFVAAGLMRVDDRSYVVTERGRDLTASLVALTEWGDRWAAPDGPPVTYHHEDCGGRVHHRLTCDDCGQPVAAAQVEARPARGKSFTA